MKKQIYVLATLLAATCGLAACGSKSSEYAALNEMLDVGYSKIEITVTETFEENLSLESKYTIEYSDSQITVGYTVEKFAELSINKPLADIKTTLKGEAVIQGGEIVSVEGDDINLSADIAKTGFAFKKKYFKNAELKSMYLKADVKNVSGFMGTKLTCTNMKVDAFFMDAFDYINIMYTSAGGNAVEYRYNFTL